MQPVCRSIEAHHDVVFLDRRAHGHVDYGLCLIWIHEVERAAFQDVTVALEDQIAAGEIHATKHNRFGGRASDFQVRCAVQAQGPAYQTDPVGGHHREVELDLVGKSLCRRG